MSSDVLVGVDKAFIFHQRCDSRSAKTVALPFFEVLHSNLVPCGFAEDLHAFTLPSVLFAEFEDRGPQAAAGAKGWIIGLSLFLGCSLSEWSLNKAYDFIYDKKIQPAINVLHGKIANEKEELPTNSSYCFQYGIWYAADEVYVQLNINVETTEDLVEIKNLILQAEEKAQQLIDAERLTKKVVIFTVRDGAVVGAPMVSEKLLQLMPNKALGPVR